MSVESHPDRQALDDWPIYGPRDGKIAELVQLLARQHDLRLREIEAVILAALELRLEKAVEEKRN